MTPLIAPTPAPAVTGNDLAANAPPMPAWFYGRVEFVFEGGKLVITRVEQTFRPPSRAGG